MPTTHDTVHETDVLIVGAGPAGLFGAYYAGFRGMSVTLVDSLPEIGGQVSALYPEKASLDIAGFPTVKGGELINALLEESASARPRFSKTSLVCASQPCGTLPSRSMATWPEVSTSRPDGTPTTCE